MNNPLIEFQPGVYGRPGEVIRDAGRRWIMTTGGWRGLGGYDDVAWPPPELRNDMRKPAPEYAAEVFGSMSSLPQPGVGAPRGRKRWGWGR